LEVASSRGRTPTKKGRVGERTGRRKRGRARRKDHPLSHVYHPIVLKQDRSGTTRGAEHTEKTTPPSQEEVGKDPSCPEGHTCNGETPWIGGTAGGWKSTICQKRTLERGGKNRKRGQSPKGGGGRKLPDLTFFRKVSRRKVNANQQRRRTRERRGSYSCASGKYVWPDRLREAKTARANREKN